MNRLLSHGRRLRALLAATMGLALGGLVVLPSAAQAAPKPAVLEIITVPALPGARFMVDGRLRAADAQGIVRVHLPTGSRRHTVGVRDRKLRQRDRHLSFVRWYEGGHEQDFRADLTGLQVQHNLRIKAAYRATYTLRYSFVDLAKVPVDRERVQRVEFRGDHGQTVRGDGSGSLTVLGIRPVVSGGTLVAKQVHYTVQRVEVDGSNVVQVNAQQFVPSQEATLTVSLLLRSVHFSTRDMLFGHPIGRSLELRYPDGRQVEVPLDASGKASLDSLARGEYSVRLNVAGLSFERPFVLSRNQYVDLPVLTAFDLGVIGGILTLMVVVLSVLRRRGGPGDAAAREARLAEET